MEFGPRALGCRSIVGDARSREMQSVMNLKIKFRESFRPFAPIVLRDRVSDYFEMRRRGRTARTCCWSPSVAEDKRAQGDRMTAQQGWTSSRSSGRRCRRSPTSTTRPGSRPSTRSAIGATTG